MITTKKSERKICWFESEPITLKGRDEIEAAAANLDEATRYVKAGPVMKAQGLRFAEPTEGDVHAPAVKIDGEYYQFTRNAAYGLLQRLGVSIQHLREGGEMANQILKAASTTGYGKRQLDRSHLVVDQHEGCVHGVVGDSYERIKHMQLVARLSIDDGATASIRGTMLRVRSGTARSFVACNRDGPDKLEIYNESWNSLAGESTFGVGAYIYRTVCLNGLMGLVD